MNTSTARTGYSRVSTADQNHNARILALKAAGCAMIRTEAGNGSSLKSRPEPGIILNFIHLGEKLAVTRIDRLARSLRDLQRIVEKIGKRSAHLAATEQPVDASSAAGKAFFDMLGVFAEFKTNLRR
ncbi:MAG: recombinase family protein [Albidovulum sp.]|nr:recombinase family protein [Albidovulum sp.]MDE0303297.1 recombinase family protein [Albidovulum sp.]